MTAGSVFSMGLNRREFIKASAFAAAASAAHAQESSTEQIQIGAYYFPNYHVDPRNEEVHGKGWTEWEITKRGEPKFEGHHQPKKPLWGYGDEADSSVFEKKIDAAAEAGLSHFIFDWYWYEGAPFLHRGLEQGYLHAANRDKVKFCLMWANHDWVNLMPARLHEVQTPLLYRGTYDAEEFGHVTDYIISRYLSHPSYYKINGAPYFSIYELNNLVERMGGLTVAQGAIELFRDKVRKAGFPDLHLNAVAWGVSQVPNIPEFLKSLDVQSVTSYTWTHHCSYPHFPDTEYEIMFDQAEAYWMKARELFGGVPYHVDVSMGWDSSPRSCQSDKYENAGYPFMPILKGNTPQAFQQILARAKRYMDSHPDVPRILTINSWNEWTEGSHLEPEVRYGLDYLHAIRNVFAKV